ncbi:hypothetical protein [Cobetia sp. 29-18-1]|nr:hypothetical protein [Cobetia sp. 29-18-1]MDH2299786.1 hypothetical protein [Cobetia sp. 29-18-1]
MFMKLLIACELLSRLIDWTAKQVLLALLLTPDWVFAYLAYKLLFD